MNTILSICVFCGASTGTRPLYKDAAAHFGQKLAQQGIELVWGGGHVGLMGVLADATLAHGGKTFGVIPAFMAKRELAHPFSTEMTVVDSMHTRKAVMAERANGFVALPGGWGTLDELFEIMTWAQLQIHHKPIGLLNVGGFFNPMLDMLSHMVEEGFVRPRNMDLLCVSEDAEMLIELMRQRLPPEGDWLDKVNHLERS